MNDQAKPAAGQGGPITLPPLPYGYAALEPHISSKTLEFHHDKHHKAYVDKTNALIAGTRYAQMPLEEIVRASHGAAADRELFNNAAQAWNHDFYWKSLHPGGVEPTGPLVDMIKSAFESLDGLKSALAKAAVGQFGSGWAWLVVKDDRLAIQTTGNAETPMAGGTRCLLTVDVWEHAYYLDYQNRRPDYAGTVVGKLLNWDFALRNLQQAPNR